MGVIISGLEAGKYRKLCPEMFGFITKFKNQQREKGL